MPKDTQDTPLQLLQKSFPRISATQLKAIAKDEPCLVLNPALLGISQFPTRESQAYEDVTKLNNAMLELGYVFQSQMFRTFMGEKRALEMWIYYKSSAHTKVT